MNGSSPEREQRRSCTFPRLQGGKRKPGEFACSLGWNQEEMLYTQMQTLALHVKSQIFECCGETLMKTITNVWETWRCVNLLRIEVTENSAANRHKQSLLWKICEFFVPGEVKRKEGFWEDQALCVCVQSLSSTNNHPWHFR